jgi:small ligand-binding sensory domain FIST
MIRVGTAYSTHRTAEKAAEAAALGALTKAGISKADHAIVFASSKFHSHFETILKKISKITETTSIIGASGHGIITEESEVEQQAGIGLMVISSDEIEANSFLVTDLQESNLRAGEKAGEILRSQNILSELLLLFPDSFSFQSHLFFDGFENSYGYVPMIGGAAAEDGKDEKTYQFHGTDVKYDSIAGLALSGNFRTEVGITRSCQPIGESFQITKADGNMIYEMDGRPAYDILLESISSIEFKNPDQIFQSVFFGVPLRSYQTEFLNAHYLIRNIMGVNAKKGMVACISPIEEGEFVTFTVRDPSRARQDMSMMLEDLQFRLAPSKPHFGFYFNCCARGQMLYGQPHQDVSMIRNAFPDVPILGFFTYGEIAPIDHVNHLHHHSGVLVMVAPK